MKTLSRYRWLLLAILFFATTVNYADRMIISVLMPVIRHDIHVSDQQYGYVTAIFQITYGIGNLIFGKVIDRVGTRVGYAVALAWWSLAAMFHAITHSLFDLAMWRGMLGLAEGGNFPAAIKAIAEWFPKRDRAWAAGICVAGSNFAPMIGPPLFVAMSAHFGWRASFFITGSSGILCLALWLLVYRRPEELPEAVKDHRETVPPTWSHLFRYRQTWGFVLGKFFTDPVWWFYLFWLPLYLFDVRHLDLQQVGWALPVIYLTADIGSIGGGWVSGFLIRKGVPIGRARKIAMAICASCMPIAALAALAAQVWLAIALISLGTAAHQGWSANLLTTPSDVFPDPTVASVIGIGQFFASVGGVLFSSVLPGLLIAHFGYLPVFLIMGCFHPLALLCVHLLMGGLEPVATDFDSVL